VTEGATTKAVFTYSTSVAAGVRIPYGNDNGLFGDDGHLIATPPQTPPTFFESGSHGPFVVTIPGNQITWTVKGTSVVANPADSHTVHLAPPIPSGAGTYVATLPDGTKVDLDDTPPAEPVALPEP